VRLHELKPAQGSTSTPKRKGRGIGSGLGKTAGRGHKGQKARSGGGVRPGFEGGQMPLVSRLPKRGFTNIFARVYSELNVEDLNCFEKDTVVTPDVLKECGLIKKLNDGVKISREGDLTRQLTVKAHKFSKSAQLKIESAGGSTEVL